MEPTAIPIIDLVPGEALFYKLFNKVISAISRKCINVFDAFIILLEHIQLTVVNQFSIGIVLPS